jgi:hypothetical protein
VSEDQENRDRFSETDDDVEAHRLNTERERFSDAEEKGDKFAKEDEPDVEGHMLGGKVSSGKVSPKHSAG